MTHVNPGIIWTNLHLLFWLSLVPFATAWMGENYFSANTVAVYAIVLECCGMAYYFLQKCIQRSHQHETKLADALERSRLKGIFSQIAYVAAIPLAYVHPAISCVLFLAVSAAWIVPDRSIEKALEGK